MHRTLTLGLLSGLLAVAAFPAAPPDAGAATAPLDPWLARVPEELPGAPPFPAELRARLARKLRDLGAGYVPRTRHRRPDGSPLYSNRLLLERSPYLRQHAHNPVDWYPWGDEAFVVAKQLGRPVLVSIGYSTCHWCHVMEEESFDDPEIARLLNQGFVAIKVDREVRPDVDAVYMAAILAMNGRGGWPLNVWMTPDRKPFFAGTYFPPADRGGRPGLPGVLQSIREEYAADPARVQGLAERVAAAISEQLETAEAQSSELPAEGLLGAAVSAYARGFDATWGGLGSGTKFPATLPVRLLLRYHRRAHDERALHMATLSLEKMMDGGLRDQVGGGFHRYATERRWLVPHFEKMLYDNALLAVAYLEAAQVTGRADFAGVVRDTLGYVEREMTSPEGGFYSATDADSETPSGELEEGFYFTWTPQEIDAALAPEDAKLAKAYYGVTPEGNFEHGRSILHTWRSEEEVAQEQGIPTAELERRLPSIREGLYAARSRRAPPLRDEKILAAWNGLAISAFARAGLVLGEPAFVRTAARAASFVLERMRVDGRLRRVFSDDRAEGPAFLEDYAFLIAALVDLYEAQPDPRWLRDALALQAVQDAHYADASGGGYYKTARDQERLLAREKPGSDGAVPSGNSVAAQNLLRLADLTGDENYRERALLLFSAFRETLERSPTSLAELLLALDYELDAAKEVVLVQPPNGGDPGPMLDALRATYLPNRVLSRVTQGPDLEAHAALVPLVAGRVARNGRVTAYVCENRVCGYPTSDPAVFAGQLASAKPIGKP